MAADFRLNKAGVGALLRSPQVSRELQRRAQRVANAARSGAPVGPERGGHIRDSIDVDTTPGKDRARARVVANKPYAAVIDTAWLARAIDAGGGQ